MLLKVPACTWPGKKLEVSGWKLSRAMIQFDLAKVAGQITSAVMTSGVALPAMKRWVSCW